MATRLHRSLLRDMCGICHPCDHHPAPITAMFALRRVAGAVLPDGAGMVDGCEGEGAECYPSGEGFSLCTTKPKHNLVRAGSFVLDDMYVMKVPEERRRNRKAIAGEVACHQKIGEVMYS